jgi:acyl-CoA thioester hydrolase
MPVVEAACRYRAPARYDDLLDVVTRIEEIGPASVSFAYRVVRRADGQLLATGQTRHAAVDPRGRPRRIPEEVKRCLLG